MRSATDGPHPPDMFGTVQNPIRMMEIERQEAGDRHGRHPQLSHDYAPPADACNTYRLVLKDELEASKSDLHRHVELENNVLFPETLELEEKTNAWVAASNRIVRAAAAILSIALWASRCVARVSPPSTRQTAC